MFNTLRFLTATATALTALVAPLHTANTDTGSRAKPNVVLTGMSVVEEEATLRSVGLFAEAGLELPPVEIRRHRDLAGCNGHEGLHRRSGEQSVIDICTTETDEYEQRTIVHELGHAWSFHYITDEQREAFQTVRGWTFWMDYKHADWEDNGAEQAAEIIVWALSDHPVPVVKIDHNSCADLHAGYVALTGLEPLHGFTDFCNSTASVRRS